MANDDLMDYVEAWLPLLILTLQTESAYKRLPKGDGAKKKGPLEFRCHSLLSTKNAFFYGAECYLGRTHFVSDMARTCDEAINHPAVNGKPEKLFDLRRDEIRGRKTDFKLILEHVYTGRMFWNHLKELKKSESWSAQAIADLLRKNFQTAWIHRDENDKKISGLPASHRGVTLGDALHCYDECGIRLRKSAADLEPFDRKTIQECSGAAACRVCSGEIQHTGKIPAAETGDA